MTTWTDLRRRLTPLGEIPAERTTQREPARDPRPEWVRRAMAGELTAKEITRGR